MNDGVASAVGQAVNASRRAGPVILLVMALLVALALLGWERYHGEQQTQKANDRWSSAEQKAYEVMVHGRFEKDEARIQALEQSAASTREALESIRREQSRQGAQLDRVLERLPAR